MVDMPENQTKVNQNLTKIKPYSCVEIIHIILKYLMNRITNVK